MSEYERIESQDSKNITDIIGQLSLHPDWNTFLNWMFRKAAFPYLELSDPDPNRALCQVARLDLVLSIVKEINKTKNKR